MLCKVFIDNTRVKIAYYGVAKVAKGKTDSEYTLKSFTKIESDLTKYGDHECLTMLLIKNVLYEKFKDDDVRFTEVKNH
jgi:hypothetical protein